MFFVTLLAGYASTVALDFVGLHRRRLLAHGWVLLLTPLYWFLLSLAAWRAVFQLLLAPQLWEKTDHGLAKSSRLAKGSVDPKPPDRPQVSKSPPDRPQSFRLRLESCDGRATLGKREGQGQNRIQARPEPPGQVSPPLAGDKHYGRRGYSALMKIKRLNP